ncbi:MAG: PPOX class F420-dependent oxidoreductase [Deltaproteobacteria bacterium]|nr:PPOX class F420-dependent oxidoreductase [Deltaproteobacteria bacterium]MBW2419288.1 PPOX class F420-dependent oxidoreductase [Deltaproteobacteria bacterium]
MADAGADDLGREQYVSLGTFRRDGREVKTPVWIGEHGGKLYAFSEGEAGKVKRVRATGRVTLTPCDMRGNLRGEPVAGRGVIVNESALLKAVYGALRRKYGWQMRLLDGLSTLSGKIGQRAVIEIALD